MPPAFLTEPTPPYGTVEQVSPMVGRLVADNPSRFTYHGTGTFLVGPPEGGRVAIIDAGPDDADHIAAVLAAVQDFTSASEQQPPSMALMMSPLLTLWQEQIIAVSGKASGPSAGAAPLCCGRMSDAGSLGSSMPLA